MVLAVLSSNRIHPQCLGGPGPSTAQGCAQLGQATVLVLGEASPAPPSIHRSPESGPWTHPPSASFP